MAGGECPLCRRHLESAKAIREHIKKGKVHQNLDQAAKEEALKAVPKDVCPHCRKEKANLGDHLKTCGANATKEKGTEGGRGNPYSGLSNNDFLEQAKQKMMTKAGGIAENTAKIYISHIKDIIEYEKSQDKEFLAWQWLLVSRDTEGNLHPQARRLREVHQYLSVLMQKGQRGDATRQHIDAAYAFLNDWFKETLNSQSNDPREWAAQNDASLKDERKRLGRGKTVTGQGKKSNEGGDLVVENLDPAITQELVDTFQQSSLRREALQRFAAGKFTCPKLGIKNMEDARVFLKLELFVTNCGSRLDLLENMTLAELNGAVEALSRCPHCERLVVYVEHREYCVRRPVSETGYDSGSDASQQIGTLWRVAVSKHKTARTYGYKEVNIRTELLGIIRKFVTVNYGSTPDPAIQPFQEGSRQRILTKLRSIIVPESPKLWDDANDKKPLGLNALRHLETGKVMQTKDPAERDARFRAMGTSKQSHDSNYKDRRFESAVRSNACRATGCDIPVVPAPVSAPRTSAESVKEAVARIPKLQPVTSKGRAGANQGPTLVGCPGCAEQVSVNFQVNLEAYGGRSCTKEKLEVLLRFLREFEKHEQARNPLFALARLGNVYTEARDDKLLSLPPWTGWLNSCYPNRWADGQGDEDRFESYELLRDFLLDLLEKHQGKHITPQQNQSRRLWLANLPRRTDGWNEEEDTHWDWEVAEEEEEAIMVTAAQSVE